jgi:hypothetical protein
MPNIKRKPTGKPSVKPRQRPGGSWNRSGVDSPQIQLQSWQQAVMQQSGGAFDQPVDLST